jgi:hypothetical protein
MVGGVGFAVLILLLSVAVSVRWPGRSAPPLPASPAPPVSAAVAAVQAWEALPACPGSAPMRSTRSHPNAAADGPSLEEAQPPTLHDLDGDGHLDLIVPHQLGARTLIWWGPLRAAGWFDVRTELPLGRACGPAAVGDLNGDGHLDLAHPLCENGVVVVQTMQGRAPLGPPARDEQGSEPRGGAITDWDHDGRADLALWLMSGKVVVRRSTPGGLAPPVTVGTSEGPIAAAPEGGLAVLLDGQVQVLASGRPRLTLPTPPFTHVWRLMPGPSDGLILVGEGPTGLAAALVRLDGGAACRYPAPLSRTAALADLNGDGLMDEADVVTCGYCTSSYRVGIGG